MRFASLIIAAAVVTSLIAILRRPETADRFDQVFAATGGQGQAEVAPVANEASVQPHTSAPPTDLATLQRILELAGWNRQRLASLSNQPLSAERQTELLELLRRLQRFDSFDLANWATKVEFDQLVAEPDEHRGQIYHLTGRVDRIVQHTLPPELAARFELPVYYECEIALDGGGNATIITARAPETWTTMESLNEPAASNGLFIGTHPKTSTTPTAVFVSREIAWHPSTANPPAVSNTEALLGSLGMDVGLFDAIEQRKPIRASERDAFYALLATTKKIGTAQLIGLAERNLSAVRMAWEAIARTPATRSDAKRQALAREVVQLADQERYSVAPLFNEPAKQVGELVLLEGLARRAIRVDAGELEDGRPNEIARRFGIVSYYEVDIFTDDSQNNPIVFCTLNLPAGFPVGESIREQVRVAGFFFKSWNFENRRARVPEPKNASTAPAATRQFAPLLIGPEPIWIPPAAPADSTYTAYVLTGLFVLGTIAIWTIGWWLNRSDRRSALADRYSLPPGASLDDLEVPPVEESADFHRPPH